MIKRNPWLWLWACATLLALLSPPSTGWARQDSNDNGTPTPETSLTFKGVIRARPPSTTSGEWLIGDRRFSVDTATDFEEGIPTVGDCVEVTYVTQNSRNRALTIDRDDDCPEAPVGQEIYGPITSFPAGLIGTWVISGTSYLADAHTAFVQSDGKYAVGACVEVKYVTENTTRRALRIATEDNGCNSTTPPVLRKVRGIVESLPASPFLGEWKIGGITYTVTISTHLGTRFGAFYPGACVGVVFDPASPTRIAVKIESERRSDCGADNAPPQAQLRLRGLISASPTDGLFGAWTIGGKAFQARTGVTRFDPRGAPPVVGACAEVRYFVEGTVNVAMLIDGKPPYECGSKTEGFTIYGLITQLPDSADLLGIWKIGGRDFVVTSTTTLSTTDGSFVVGALVKVTFVHEDDGTLRAQAIETRDVPDKARPIVPLAKALGRIEALPASGITGTWTIGGASYAVSATTRLDPANTSFAISQCVEVHYTIVTSDTLAAVKIERKDDTRCTTQPGSGNPIGKAYGSVELMPPDGLIGSWQIGGLLYTTSAQTVFDQKRGALVAGAFVEVTFVLSDSVREALTIETHVPPCAGDRLIVGPLKRSSTGPGTQATSQVWSVSGTSFSVVDATILDDRQASLTDGQLVIVDAATDTTAGGLVASSVRAFAADSAIALPLVIR